MEAKRMQRLVEAIKKLAIHGGTSMLAHIGIGLFGIGAFAAIVGWLPMLIWVSVDAAAGTAVVGVMTAFLGATIWLFCME